MWQKYNNVSLKREIAHTRRIEYYTYVSDTLYHPIPTVSFDIGYK